MRKVWRFLRSPKLALAVLVFLSLYGFIAAWLPWTGKSIVPPPKWVERLGLDRPFSSYFFLLACVLFFINTFACTLNRVKKTWGLWQGELPQKSMKLLAKENMDFQQFILSCGFKGDSSLFFRFRFAFWGGLVMHVGILVLLVSIVVQQSLHDGGAFELTEGETIRLNAPGAVFGRERGLFAPSLPPDIEVTLTKFDAFLHQKGYARDRLSTLRLVAAGGKEQEAVLDRAHGVKAGKVVIYQAIPTGLAINMAVPGMGLRSLHLREDWNKRTSNTVNDPSGKVARFVVESERPLDDPMGTGPLKIRLEQDGQSALLEPNVPFRFGSGNAMIFLVTRWGGYTYAYSPGVSAVFLGFFVILCGCALLLFPAGFARPGELGSGVAGYVYLRRGGDELKREWEQRESSPGNPKEKE